MFDSDCAAAKRKVRMQERRYRRTRTAADRRAWIAEIRRKQRLYLQKQNVYWETKIAESYGKPVKLWANLSAVLCRERMKFSAADGLDADSFSRAFHMKTDGVWLFTAAALPPAFDDLRADFCRLNVFVPVDADTVQRLTALSANKNCELDPAPTWIVKRYAGELAPLITALFSSSFRDDVFPCAVVTPVLKKAKLDTLEVGNYRPISNLTFTSKLLERCSTSRSALTCNRIVSCLSSSQPTGAATPQRRRCSMCFLTRMLQLTPVMSRSSVFSTSAPHSIR